MGRWKYVLLAALTVVALAVAGFALLKPPVAGPVPASVASYTPPPKTYPYLFTALGDSYTGGSPMGGSRGTPTNWVISVANQLRAQGLDVFEVEQGIGGSGYVNRGPEGDTIGERAAKKLNKNTDVAVFFGSINDRAQPLDKIIEAADKAWTAAKSDSPSAQFIAVGPAWMHRDVPPEIYDIRDALKNLAVKHGFDFVDPLAERWFFDHPEWIGSDGTHPTDAGHLFMASKILPHVQAAISREGAPARK